MQRARNCLHQLRSVSISHQQKRCCFYLSRGGRQAATWHNALREVGWQPVPKNPQKEQIEIGWPSRLGCALAFALKLTRPALASLLFPDLLLGLQESSTAVEITERRLAAEGSSVLMHAPDTKNVNITEWEYTRTSTPEFILQCYEGCRSPTIYPAYQGRVVFYPNGSILLQKLRETDSGTYKATINLRQDKARTTLLRVISKSCVGRMVSSKLHWSVQRTGPQGGHQSRVTGS